MSLMFSIFALVAAVCPGSVRPVYHHSIPGCGIPADPNGAFFADGRYHLMYLYKTKETAFQPFGKEENHWGHRSSADLVHWTEHGDAIRKAADGSSAYSGGAFVDEDGTCYLSYWMYYGPYGIGLVKSRGRDYTQWSRTPCASEAIIRSSSWGYDERIVGGEKKIIPVADPSNIWKKGERYYLLAGNLVVTHELFGDKPDTPPEYQGDHLALFSSDDLRNWRYEHDFYQRRTGESDATGWTDAKEDNMCPTFLPLPCSPAGGKPSGKHLLSFISHCRGCQYYIGTYDRSGDRFIPESHGRMTWKDSTVFAPEAMLDGKGRQLLWAWLHDNRDNQYADCGWTGVYCLPRSLFLREDGTLGIAVPEEYMELAGRQIDAPENGFESDCCRIELELDSMAARSFALEIRRSADGQEKTVLRYDDRAGELVFDGTKSGHQDIIRPCAHVPVERAPFKLGDGEALKLTVFIDHEIVDVFANDRQAISRRVYPKSTSRGVSLVGAAARRFKAVDLSGVGPCFTGLSDRQRTISASAADVLEKGFAIRMSVNLDDVHADEALYEAGAVKLGLRMAGVDKGLQLNDTACQNYMSFALADGSCPVLEAQICDVAGRIGVPLGALGRREGVHEVVLVYDPPRWAMSVDGHEDEEFPVPSCPVVWPSNACERILSARVGSTSFSCPVPPDARPSVPDSRAISRPIQYWTPDGHNTWVGDVAPGYFDGRLHLFYLLDRRHHRSGKGSGRHQFAHLSTTDLVHWCEHPLAVPIREWWQTVGTGTPFMYQGKLRLAFGWHSDRYAPHSNGKPLGAAYATSEDGIHFSWDGTMMGDTQNPSVYNRGDGLCLVTGSFGGVKGLYESDRPGDWKLVDGNLPFAGDCPSLFDWHGHRYLLQGFYQMAYNADGRVGGFVDWTAGGEDIYDGLGVPMVVPWKGDRRLLIGWLIHPHGWGGWLVFRELVAYPDGHLGTKWVPELVPPGDLHEFQVTDPDAPFVVRFGSAGKELEFRIDAREGRAQFADAEPGQPAPRQTSLSERYAVTDRAALGEVKSIFSISVHASESFAITGIRGLDRPYRVRLVSYYDPKADVTVFDAEIAGQRTMIVRRVSRYRLLPGTIR